jgi:predicted MFS family arabinose efflux permease
MKWICIFALLVFEGGSTVCATATSSEVFIIGRAVPGIGASGIFSGALALASGLVSDKVHVILMFYLLKSSKN